MKYIVFGIGRTGSLLLTSIMAPDDSGRAHEDKLVGGVINGISMVEPSQERYDYECQAVGNIVIHTHHLDHLVERLKLDTTEFDLIISDRINRFEQLMSFFVAEATAEYNNYTDKQLPPFNIDLNDFTMQYPMQATWPGYYEKPIPEVEWRAWSWKSKTVINYEDLISADNMVQYVANRLNLPVPEKYEYDLVHKSPRNYKDYVLNWKECYNIAQEFDRRLTYDRNF